MSGEARIQRKFMAILRGMASLIDPTVLRKPRSKATGFACDAEAIAGDWAMVGHDIRKAVQRTAPSPDGTTTHP